MTTNKIYQTPETAITFGSNSDTVAFTPKNKANGAGRVSAQYDRGAGAKAMRYRWEARTKYQANATLGTFLQIFIATAHNAAASVDGSLGQADADLSVLAQLTGNTKQIGVIMTDGTAARVGPFYASGVVTILARYISVAWWNASGQSLTNVDADHQFTLVPIPDDIQASA